jgi:RHS repeat-associated protein
MRLIEPPIENIAENKRHPAYKVLKYDPDGNRVWKKSTVSGQETPRKYIVDIVGELPVILMEINPGSNLNSPVDDTVAKTYIYANGQILAQHDGRPRTAAKYFYLHDRLGSVRQVINTSGNVKNYYTYNPFGEVFATENTENVSNPFKFTGQYFDSEINEYYLRARQYDPQIGRFTSRDPVFGNFQEPMTLHRYLYCQNDPINRTDPLGLFYLLNQPGISYSYGWEETQQVISAANQMVGIGPVEGPLRAFGWRGEGRIGEFDYKMYYELYKKHLFFELGTGERLYDSEFGNYLAGYTLFYNYRAPGFAGGLVAGHVFGVAEWYNYRTGDSDRYVRWAQDDFGSMYWQFRGAQEANREAYKGLGAQLDNIILGYFVWNLNILRTLDYFQYN